MTGFSAIRGQRRTLDLLTTMLRKDRLPHALIFTGIDGIGKQTAAKAFAMACNCGAPQSSGTDADRPPGTDACGRCRNCRRIQAENHPDVLYLRPSGGMIRIAAIRELIARLAIKPYEAGRRVVIVAEAHTMNPEAGNALLKVLEEPPANTLLILTARQMTDLLPTIASRGQQIRFAPLPADILVDLLVANEELAPDDAAAASALAGGSYTRAVAMAREGWIPRRRWLAGIIGRLKDQPVPVLLALAEKLAAGKALLPDILAWMLGWYRDLLVYPYRPDQILNRDLEDQIRTALENGAVRDRIAAMQALHQTLKALQENANPRLAMESLVLRLAAAQGSMMS